MDKPLKRLTEKLTSQVYSKLCGIKCLKNFFLSFFPMVNNTKVKG